MSYFSYYRIFSLFSQPTKTLLFILHLDPMSFTFSKLSQLKDLVDVLEVAVRLWTLETALQLITIHPIS